MSLLDGSPQPESWSRWKKAAVAIGSLAVTGALVLLALVLGSWALGQREGSLHVGRLERLVEKHPRGEAVRAGLEGEGSPLLGEAAGPVELAVLVRRLTPADEATVLAKARAAARTRAFRAGPYVYWLFFDGEDALAGYAISRAPLR
jgi:hypothetical protein